MDKPQQAGAAQKVQQEELNGLISSLSRLYSTIARRLWHWRVQNYHKDGCPDVGADIQEPLGRRIDSLSGEPAQRIAAEGTGNGGGQAAATRRDEYREAILGNALNGFTEHRKEVTVDAGLGERLRHSTWEHIHQALRLAREGDDKAAHLHAGFANNALKEAGHYLSEADYRGLVEEVADYLEQHPL